MQGNYIYIYTFIYLYIHLSSAGGATNWPKGSAEAVRSLAWEPGAARLAVATGSTRVYLWAPEGASCVHVPAPGLKAAAVAWSPAADGSFLLSDAAADGAFCCAYPADGGD